MPTHHLLSGFSLWGLEGLYNPPDLGLADVAAAGYNTIEINTFLWSEELARKVRDNNLLPIIQCFPQTPEELDPVIKQANAAGALLVNAHASHAHQSQDDAATLINALIDKAEEAGVRLLFETHRGRITQDLWRTADLCHRIPRLRLTLDVSHYVISEERPGPTDDLKPVFEPLLDRVEMIHGRISNGEQIQVDIGDGTGGLAQLYKRFWSEAMRRWRQRNAPGSAMIFTPELGPLGYAIPGADGNEFSNRWEQSLVMRQLAESAWRESASANGPLW